MFRAEYNGTKRGNTIHEYVHLHQTYHSLNEKAPSDHRITWGKAARSDLLLDGFTATHLTTVKETLEIKISELTFDEVITQIVNAETAKAARQNEERDNSYGQMADSSERSEEQEQVLVVTAATAVTLDDDTTVILVIHEALYLGEGQHTSLLNLNQVRFAGHKADDIPQFLSQGTSIHGIETTNEDCIPFTLQGKSSLLYVRVPTEWEKENCEHITLTSDEPWDPSSGDWEESEAKFTRKRRYARSITSKGDAMAPTAQRTAAMNCSNLENKTYVLILCKRAPPRLPAFTD